jgi:dCMP deaminase
VVYQMGYRDTSGIDFLEKAGVLVEQIVELE